MGRLFPFLAACGISGACRRGKRDSFGDSPSQAQKFSCPARSRLASFYLRFTSPWGDRLIHAPIATRRGVKQFGIVPVRSAELGTILFCVGFHDLSSKTRYACNDVRLWPLGTVRAGAGCHVVQLVRKGQKGPQHLPAVPNPFSSSEVRV